jgi:hypothetical protein
MPPTGTQLHYCKVLYGHHGKVVLSCAACAVAVAVATQMALVAEQLHGAAA